MCPACSDSMETASLKVDEETPCPLLLTALCHLPSRQEDRAGLHSRLGLGTVLRTANLLLELRMTFCRSLPADGSFQSTGPVEGQPPEKPWLAPHRHVRQLPAPLPTSPATQMVASPQKPSSQQPERPGACSRTQASEPLPLPHGSHMLSCTHDSTEQGARAHLCVWTHVICTSYCSASFVYASSSHRNHKHACESSVSCNLPCPVTRSLEVFLNTAGS